MKTILLKGLLREFLIACAIVLLCGITGGADFCIILFFLYLGYGIIEIPISFSKEIRSNFLAKMFGGIVLLSAPLLFSVFILLTVLELNLINLSHGA